MDQTTPASHASAADSEPENLAVAVPYQEFKTGLPLGRFRLIVNPEKARRYVKHRLYVNGVSIPLIGIGMALGLSGKTVIGLLIVCAGVFLRWIINRQGPHILLHLAQNDPRVYYECIEYEIIEVRMARD